MSFGGRAEQRLGTPAELAQTGDFRFEILDLGFAI
jgi:hypothetical protein